MGKALELGGVADLPRLAVPFGPMNFRRRRPQEARHGDRDWA
jgi:hypothetical protein